MDQTEATPIPRTEGAIEPFFSPDGQWIAFWADGQLKKVALTGGAPVTICETVQIFGASWGADDVILFGPAFEGVRRVSANGGEPEEVFPVEGSQSGAPRPQLLPGDEWVLFTSHPSNQVVIQSLETGERQVLIENGAAT